jgi:ketosteroid isomerase-like protein
VVIVDLRGRADELIRALASSDLAAIDEICSDDILLWGTDVNEVWSSKAEVLEAFAGTFDLRVRWREEPVIKDSWLAGVVVFGQDGRHVMEARVTLVFREGLVAHAHYSVAQPSPHE